MSDMNAPSHENGVQGDEPTPDENDRGLDDDTAEPGFERTPPPPD